MKKSIIFLTVLSFLCLFLVVPAVAEENTAASYTPRAVTVKGKITAISSQTLPADLTVAITSIAPKKLKNYSGTFPVENNSIVVHVTKDTKLVRKYFGQASFSELAVGDAVSVFGKLQVDGSLNASMVRDLFIHVVFNANKGKVAAIDMAAKTFTTKKGDKEFKIFVTETTKFVKVGVANPTLADLKVGDEVNVRGVIRQAANEINADSVVIKVGEKEKQLKQLELKKAAWEKRIEAVKNNLTKAQAELEAIIKKIAELRGSATTTAS